MIARSGAVSADRGVALWRQRNFVLFWTGESLSAIGSQVSLLAIPLTAIDTLSAPAKDVGIISALASLPFLLITPFAGVWVDRSSVRRMLLLTHAGRSLLLGLIPLLAVLSILNIGSLGLVAFLAGGLTALFQVAYLSFVPVIVPKMSLVGANSALAASNSAADSFGPSVAGFLIQAFTAPIAVLIDACSYVVAAMTVFLIRTQDAARDSHGEAAGGVAGVVNGVVAGVRIIWHNSLLRTLLIFSGFFNFFEQILMTTFLLYAVRTVHLSAGLIGVLFSFAGLGALAGTAVAGRAGERFGVGFVLRSGAVLACLPMALVVTPYGSQAAAFAMMAVALTCYGVGLTAFNIYAVSQRQAVIPTNMLGRANASYRFISYGPIPLGGFCAGVLASAIGYRVTLTVAVAGLCAACLVVCFSKIVQPLATRGPEAAGP